MEVFMPILIAAVVFGFQIYTNFKKEQEKAKKRFAGKPLPVKTKPPVRQQPINTLDRGENTRYDIERVEEVEEVKRTRAIHQAHMHQYQQLAPYQIAEKENDSSMDIHFDLRDAVIKSAILNRPYT